MSFRNFLVKDPYLLWATMWLSSGKLQKCRKDTLIHVTVKINEAYLVCSVLPLTMWKNWQKHLLLLYFVAWPYSYCYKVCGRTTSESGFRDHLGKGGSNISNSTIIIHIINSIYVLNIWQKLTTLYPEKKNHIAFLTLNKKYLQGWSSESLYLFVDRKHNSRKK